MFTLAIADADTTTVSTHPSREVAYAELVAFAEATGHRLHVTAASWTHTRYRITTGCSGEPVYGHAVIDELCACEHTEREHDETGCTAMQMRSSRIAQCPCAHHQPVCGEPSLFAEPHPTSSQPR
jgi:hypothetical protein